MELGKFNTLKVARKKHQGFYLLDEENNEVLLPTKYAPKDLQPDEEIEVFVYKDNENRPIATTLNPTIILDEFALLKVKEVNELGAFMDWGIEKDLFVPFAEQRSKMQAGKWYIVILYYDDMTDRLVGSSKYADFVSDEMDLKVNESVELLIADKTDLGYNVIINSEYVGLLFNSEVFKPIRYGETHQGYIKQIREDGKIDVTLQKQGYGHIEESLKPIVEKLERNNGYLNLNDKSDPETIRAVFGISKKVFKKAIGALYKQRIITIKDDGIYLN